MIMSVSYYRKTLTNYQSQRRKWTVSFSCLKLAF